MHLFIILIGVLIYNRYASKSRNLYKKTGLGLIILCLMNPNVIDITVVIVLLYLSIPTQRESFEYEEKQEEFVQDPIQPSMYEIYLNLFELQPGFSKKELKDAYYTLSKRYHPDVYKEKDSNDWMVTINLGREYLEKMCRA